MLAATLCDVPGVAHVILYWFGELSQIFAAGSNPRHWFQRRLVGHWQILDIVNSLYRAEWIPSPLRATVFSLDSGIPQRLT
jgi:hypothetical protein